MRAHKISRSSCGDNVPIDLNILSLYRLNGQEQSGLPGLMSFAPPRKAARGREREPLLVSLQLNGNTPFSNAEYEKLTSGAAAAFHGAHGALTSALRAAAEFINRALLERNLSTTGRGQYAIGWLTVAALRETQLTLLQCGPTHVIAFQAGEARHIHDPALSGKGLGLSQVIAQYFSQLTLQPGDRLLLCPKLPPAWESALTSDHGLQSLETTRKRMLAIVEGDVNGALMQATEGTGNLTVQRPAADETPRATLRTPPFDYAQGKPAPVSTPPALDSAPAFVPPEAAHVIGRPPEGQPSAYAIPPQPNPADEALVEQLASAAMSDEYPPSIPRARRVPEPDMEPLPEVEEEEEEELAAPAPRRTPEEIAASRAAGTRQAARAAVNGIQLWRRATERLGAALRKFLPRLLPGGESEPSLALSPAWMVAIAVAVPLVIATIGFVVYSSSGQSALYGAYITQAQAMRDQAMQETDPVRQREAWTKVLERVAAAEALDENGETNALQQEAHARLDALLGVVRLNFTPIFSAPAEIEISRMAASEMDLYMLDATQGKILRAALTGHGYEMDAAFNCSSAGLGGDPIGPLVDLLIPPKVNMYTASVMGVDALGNLLYCAPGQVPQALALTPPNTQWGRVVAITLDGNRLYVLDSPKHAVWIYNGREDANSEESTSAFPDAPYFFFGNQIPELEDAIDIAVNGDDLYLLHSDGHLTKCTFSRIETVPTRCDSPVALGNPFPAYGADNVFTQADFTQMILASPPDSSLLLFDAKGQSVARLNLRDFQLQNIWGAAIGNLPDGPFGAVAFSPNRVLYLARGGQVYITNDAP